MNLALVTSMLTSHGSVKKLTDKQSLLEGAEGNQSIGANGQCLLQGVLHTFSYLEINKAIIHCPVYYLLECHKFPINSNKYPILSLAGSVFHSFGRLIPLY